MLFKYKDNVHTHTHNNLCTYCTYLAYLLCSQKAPATNPSLSFSPLDNRPSIPLLFLLLFCGSCQSIDMEMPRTWYWNIHIYTQTIVHTYVHIFNGRQLESHTLTGTVYIVITSELRWVYSPSALSKRYTKINFKLQVRVIPFAVACALNY